MSAVAGAGLLRAFLALAALAAAVEVVSTVASTVVSTVAFASGPAGSRGRADHAVEGADAELERGGHDVDRPARTRPRAAVPR